MARDLTSVWTTIAPPLAFSPQQYQQSRARTDRARRDIPDVCRVAVQRTFQIPRQHELDDLGGCHEPRSIRRCLERPSFDGGCLPEGKGASSEETRRHAKDPRSVMTGPGSPCSQRPDRTEPHAEAKKGPNEQVWVPIPVARIWGQHRFIP